MFYLIRSTAGEPEFQRSRMPLYMATSSALNGSALLAVFGWCNPQEHVGFDRSCHLVVQAGKLLRRKFGGCEIASESVLR